MKIEIIAEIGWNFLGDVDLAKSMIESAKKSGATIAKFQFWDPTTLKPGLWDSDGRKKIYEKAALNEMKIKNLNQICEVNKIEPLYSAFTTKGAELLHNLGHKKIKIPSHEIANKDLIKFSSKHFEFIFLSTGASLKKEVVEANEILKNSNAKYNLMHCVSSYPCNIDMINLPRINWLKTLHPNVGFSDHTRNVHAPSIALSLGANVIEKHFTSDNSLEGRDNKFALNPRDFQTMCNLLNETLVMLADHGLDFQESEKDIVENYRGRWG